MIIIIAVIAIMGFFKKIFANLLGQDIKEYKKIENHVPFLNFKFLLQCAISLKWLKSMVVDFINFTENRQELWIDLSSHAI